MAKLHSMFKLPVLLLLSFPFTLTAQPKALPLDCADLKQKLLTIQQTFSKLETYKKQEIKTQYNHQYKTGFSLCGVQAVLESTSDDPEKYTLAFYFSSNQFTATAQQVKTFVDYLRKEIKSVFGETHKETSEVDPSDNSVIYDFMEKGKGWSGNTIIEINYPWVHEPLLLTFKYK